MDDTDFLPRILALLKEQNKIDAEMKKAGFKPAFYNNGWRVLCQKKELSNLLNVPCNAIKVEANDKKNYNKTHKTYDILIEHESINISKGESKGQWNDNKTLTKAGLGKLCFDKQNDIVRRQETKEYDLIGYSAFCRDTLDIKYSFYLVGQDRVSKINAIIEKYQNIKIKEIEKLEEKNRLSGEKNRLSRDDIQISAIEVLESLTDEDVICVLMGKVISRSELLELTRKRIKFSSLLDKHTPEPHLENLQEWPQMEEQHLDNNQSI